MLRNESINFLVDRGINQKKDGKLHQCAWHNSISLIQGTTAWNTLISMNILNQIWYLYLRTYAIMPRPLSTRPFINTGQMYHFFQGVGIKKNIAINNNHWMEIKYFLFFKQSIEVIIIFWEALNLNLDRMLLCLQIQYIRKM